MPLSSFARLPGMGALVSLVGVVAFYVVFGGVDVVTVGQYLRPAAWNLPVVSYATPERFESLRAAGEALGFSFVFSGPFVRSSYRAEEALAESTRRRS